MMPAVPVEAANAEALRRLGEARPVLVDCAPAADVLGLAPHAVLHAGPPVDWTRMCGPLRGALVGALLYEGWAGDPAAAARAAAAGAVRLEPCHHRGAVGPMTGLITPSMPVLVVEDRAVGNR